MKPPKRIEPSKKYKQRTTPDEQDQFEIKIERESHEPKITPRDKEEAKRCANNFQKIIKINVADDSQQNSTGYDEYLNELIEREKNVKSIKINTISNERQQPYLNRPNNLIYDPEDEFKCKSLVTLEQKETIDQFITTTTTTVRTKTKDDLFLLFDNNFFENENHSEDQLNEFFEITNNNTTRRPASGTNNNTSFNTRQSDAGRSERPRLININKNIYSCLNNYFSDASARKDCV